MRQAIDTFQRCSGSAVVSVCKRYRYFLDRIWDDSGGRVLFVGLNPSTADASVDDPTIRRCMGFAHRWGYGGLMMVNLFALRSTDPLRLTRAKDPIGPDNGGWIRRSARRAELVIACWGARGSYLNRGADILAILDDARCLGVTRTGQPRHPLYVPATQRPVGLKLQDSCARVIHSSNV